MMSQNEGLRFLIPDDDRTRINFLNSQIQTLFDEIRRIDVDIEEQRRQLQKMMDEIGRAS